MKTIVLLVALMAISDLAPTPEGQLGGIAMGPIIIMDSMEECMKEMPEAQKEFYSQATDDNFWIGCMDTGKPIKEEEEAPKY